MEDGALLQQVDREQQLMRVALHRLHVQPDVVAVLLEELPQVHAQVLEHQAKVVVVVEVAIELQHVEHVRGIGLVQLLQRLQLTHTGLAPKEWEEHDNERMKSGYQTHIISLLRMILIAT